MAGILEVLCDDLILLLQKLRDSAGSRSGLCTVVQPKPILCWVNSAAAESQLQCGAAQQGLLVNAMVLVEAENSWTQGHSWNLCVPERGSAGSCWIRTLSICCGEEGGRV